MTNFDEIGLIFLVPRRDHAVDLSSYADLLVVLKGDIPLGEPCLALSILFRVSRQLRSGEAAIHRVACARRE